MLQLKNIVKSYGVPGTSSHHIVLDGLSFQIGNGEKVAVIGPSGSGKTTFLNMAGALDIPDKGKILFEGILLAGYTKNEMAEFRNKQLGFIFQMHHLLPQLTLLENVLLPLLPSGKNRQKENLEWAEHLLQASGIWKQRNQKPSELSGGECQRTAVVRSLVNKPRLILADEPTGALDEENAGKISELLLNLNAENNSSLIVVTHSQPLASHMDKLYTLQGGKLIAG